MPADFQEHVDEPTFEKVLNACHKRGVRVTVTVRDGASITCRTEMSGNAASIDFDLWRLGSNLSEGRSVTTTRSTTPTSRSTSSNSGRRGRASLATSARPGFTSRCSSRTRASGSRISMSRYWTPPTSRRCPIPSRCPGSRRHHQGSNGRRSRASRSNRL